jgi:hypothetical protein
MKRILILGFALLFSQLTSMAQDDAISKYFSKYAEDERFTVVYISPKMFEMIAKIDTKDAEWEKAKSVISDLRGLRILVADNDDDDDNNTTTLAPAKKINGHAMYKDAMQTLNGRSYDELLTVRDGQQNVRFMTKETGGVISELLLLVGEPDEFVMLSFTGKIDLKKISALSKTLNVEGAEHLDKVKAKN